MTLLRTLRRAGAALAVLLLAGTLVATIVRWRGASRLDRAVADFTARVGPIDTAAYNRPTIQSATNPAPAFRRASELFAESLRSGNSGDGRASSRLRDLAQRSPTVVDPAEAAEIAALRSTLRPAREELRHALERRGASSFELDFTHAWDLGLPDFRALTGLGDLLLLEGRLAVGAGDFPAAVRLAGDLGFLAQVLRQEVPLIFQYIAFNFDRRQHLLLRFLGEAKAVDAATLEAGLAALEDVPKMDPLVRAIGGEGAFLHQVFHTAELRPKVATSPLSRACLWLAADHALADLLTHYGDSVAVLRSAPFASAHFPAEGDHGLLWCRELGDFGVNFDGVAIRIAATRSSAQLARAALALRLAGLATGHYPALADPSPSELTGKGIRRRDQPDGSVVLDLEGALEIWRAHAPVTPATPPLLATEWRLPALGSLPCLAGRDASGRCP